MNLVGIIIASLFLIYSSDANVNNAGYLQLIAEKETVFRKSEDTLESKGKHSKLNKRNNDFSKGFEDLNLINAFSQYLIALQIGSNKDLVKVAIDTGSSDFIVFGIDNTNCIPETTSQIHEKRDTLSENANEVQVNCSKYGVFDNYDSNSFSWNNSDFIEIYGDGTKSLGSWGMDNVFVNNNSLGKISIGVSNETTAQFGILGLGFPQLEASYRLNGINQQPYIYENFPQKLVSNGIISKAAYSISLDQDHKAKLLFGAIDRSQYIGDLYAFPMVASLLLEGINDVVTTSITLNSIDLVLDEDYIPIGDGYMSALLDSGSTLCKLPLGMFKQITKILNLDYNEDNGLYSTQCINVNHDKMLRFTFQGVSFDIPLSNFFFRSTNKDNGQDMNNDTCVLGIYPSYFSESIILGQSFLSQIYMTVDMEDKILALGYADLENTKENQIELIKSGIPSVVMPPLTETYDINHMVFSSFTEALTQPFSTKINYSTVYVKTIIDGGTSGMGGLFSKQSTVSQLSTVSSGTKQTATTNAISTSGINSNTGTVIVTFISTTHSASSLGTLQVIPGLIYIFCLGIVVIFLV
jgi:yapsin 1